MYHQSLTGHAAEITTSYPCRLARNFSLIKAMLSVLRNVCCQCYAMFDGDCDEKGKDLMKIEPCLSGKSIN